MPVQARKAGHSHRSSAGAMRVLAPEDELARRPIDVIEHVERTRAVCARPGDGDLPAGRHRQLRAGRATYRQGCVSRRSQSLCRSSSHSGDARRPFQSRRWRRASARWCDPPARGHQYWCQPRMVLVICLNGPVIAGAALRRFVASRHALARGGGGGQAQAQRRDQRERGGQSREEAGLPWITHSMHGTPPWPRAFHDGND